MAARTVVAIAALFGALGVAAGAFGAHALRQRLAAELFAVYQTAVLYHLVHALALLGVGLWLERYPSAVAQAAAWLLLAGVVLFSGSLYGMALSGVRVLGAITPLGGVAFIAGWLCLSWAAWRVL